MNTVVTWRAALGRAVTAKDFYLIARRLVRAARSGEPWAVHELMDRCLGKPHQQIDLGVDEERVQELTEIQVLERQRLARILLLEGMRDVEAREIFAPVAQDLHHNLLTTASSPLYENRELQGAVDSLHAVPAPAPALPDPAALDPVEAAHAEALAERYRRRKAQEARDRRAKHKAKRLAAEAEEAAVPAAVPESAPVGEPGQTPADPPSPPDRPGSLHDRTASGM